MAGILDGIKVITVSTFVAVPSACAILGDWGAEIISIEPPSGDPQRAWNAKESVGIPRAPANAVWEQDRRNQKSIVLDLSREEGRAIAYKLIKSADVFVSNVRENSLKNIGLDYDTLSQLNPRLIYAHFSGYGTRGPDSNLPGYDITSFWASSGIMGILGEPDDPPPQQRAGMGDQIAGITNVAGIVAALFARERHGFGQRVDTSLLSIGMWVNSIHLVASLLTGMDIPRISRKDAVNPMRNVYRCRDGRWIMLFMPLITDRYWPSFCQIMGIQELEHEARFETHQRRAENARELTSIVDGVFATRDFEEWKQILSQTELVWAPVSTVKEVANRPQALANEYIREMAHPELGKVKIVASPWNFSKTPSSLKMSGPKLGEHTQAVLLQAGYTVEEIARLRQAGVTG